MDKEPFISVIIPTRHRNDLLALCLDKLAPGVQTLPSDQYEVLVSDDGQMTTAQQMIREKYPWAKWVAGPRRGPAANRNNGAKVARGAWIVFTDDDCLPDAQWLEAFMGACGDNRYLALEGAIHPIGDINRDLAECPTNLLGGCFWSANIAITASVFREIGGFDQDYRFAAHEDVDLQMRLTQLGPILFVPSALVMHPIRQLSLISRIQRAPAEWKAYAEHIQKHPELLVATNRRPFFLMEITKYLRGIVFHLRRGRPRSAILSGLMASIGIPYIYLKLRKHSA